jgi:TRAP-type C4-dicarboxylate transport system permease small subunit
LPVASPKRRGDLPYGWGNRLTIQTGMRMDKQPFIRKATTLEEWLSQFLLAVIVLLVFVAAFTRYIGMPINWSVDIAQALFVWVIFLGANQAWRSSRHIGIDLLVKRFDARTRNRIQLLLYGVIAVFLVSLIVSGIHITIVNAGRILQDIPISYSYVTSAVPVGSFLMLLTTGRKIVLLLASKPEKDSTC